MPPLVVCTEAELCLSTVQFSGKASQILHSSQLALVILVFYSYQ